MSNKTFAEYSQQLQEFGYLPMGRYEHTIKGAARPVVFYFTHLHKQSLFVMTHTDEMGAPTIVVGVFSEELV